MKTRSTCCIAICMAALAGGMYGCGSGSGTGAATPGPSGRLVQGPVVNALVFADNVGSGTRFVWDGNSEISTHTDPVTGDFHLPSPPSYNYILVSQGGTDRLTGQNAIQMIAPAGSANITPLTTLVALDTTGNVKAKLEALMPTGIKFDADTSTTTSPAALMLAKSVETAVQSLSTAIKDKASAGSATISPGQLASIQAQTMKDIATELAKPSVTAITLAAPASLSTTLQTAAGATATTINNAVNSNISIPASTASTIASSAVTATATALNIGTSAATTTLTGGEVAAITTAAAQAFTDAVRNSANTAQNTITATATPSNYIPPTITVVTTTTNNNTGVTGGLNSF